MLLVIIDDVVVFDVVVVGVCGNDCCLLLLCFLVAGCWSLVAGCCAKNHKNTRFSSFFDTTFDKKV